MADGNQRSSATRKAQPIATGVLAYFPRALAAISEVSRRGNDKHNPGEPLHWAKEKSTDEADSAVRHIVDALEHGPLALDTEGVPNLASAAWRVLAWLERVLEGDERWRTLPKVPAAENPRACPEGTITAALERARPQPLSPELEAAREELRAGAIDRTKDNVPHGPDFFAQMNTCRDAYVRLGIAFSKVIPHGASILEIGCGTGHQTMALARLGYPITGIDPMAEYVEPGFEFHKCDPLEPMQERSGYHTVICTEVAEHIFEERADRLVEVVCNAARQRVIWSAARPGQEWEGHVNLQPPEYWHRKFKARGFRVCTAATLMLREEMLTLQAQHCGAVDNFWVLDRV